MTQLVAAVSLHYVAGDSVTLEFAVADENGDAAIISGDTIHFDVTRRAGVEPILSVGSGVTGTITNGAGGIYRITIAPEDTEELLGTYAFQSKLEDLSGDVQTVARGYLTFVPKLG